MRLETMLESLDARTLETTLRHWGADRVDSPYVELEPRLRLRRLMTETGVVQDLFDRLPPRLHDLLVHIIRNTDWSQPIDLERLDTAELDLAKHELHAAGSALAERGFFHVGRIRRSASQRDVRYEVPEEIGSQIQNILHEKKRSGEVIVTLRRFLRTADTAVVDRWMTELWVTESVFEGHAAMAAALAAPEAVRRRVDSVEDATFRELVRAAIDAGGILDGDARQRNGFDLTNEQLESYGRKLEDLLLGTLTSPSLANHGISVREGWIIVFQEVVTAELEEQSIDADRAESELQRGPDFLADVSRLARELESQPLRVTKAGEFAKASMKKLERRVLSPGFRARDPEVEIRFMLDFMSRNELVATLSDGTIRVAPKMKTWERKATLERLEDGMRFCLSSRPNEMSAVHSQGLRKSLLKTLCDIGVGRWMSLVRPATLARNRWLRDALRSDHSRRYQETHKHAPFPPLASPDSMLRSLLLWIVEGPARLGMVDAAVRHGETAPWAIRLTATGAAMLGLQAPSGTEPDGEIALVVNADHEVVVFPEAAGFTLVQEVGRFAKRVKADFAVHFQLTRESVQSAAAGGLDAAAMIELLTRTSGRELPSNVEFSLRDWCENVTRIGLKRVWIFETPDVEVTDRLCAIPEIRAIVVRRLSDTVVELSEDPSSPGLVSILRDGGFYF